VTFVQTIVRTSANPAVQNSSVGYIVNFSAPVTGVDSTDFQLTTAGLTGASVTGVTGSGATYNVTVETGTPASSGATLRLDVADDDSILDAAAAPLGGAGADNGSFTSGEVYTVNPNFVRANGATVSEPAAGTASLLFTVTLSAAAPAGGVSVGYATADGGATPATGGASCDGAADYVSENGTLNFAVGERVKTVSVNVCADASAGETGETLLLNLSGANGGSIQAAQATGTITQGTAAGAFLISELRTSGPAGANDDFVELYNNSDAQLTVNASDASGGYGVFVSGAGCDATPLLVATIPNGTVIPARGHYLLAGSAYSLGSHALGDQTLASGIGDDNNVAVFSTADVTNLSTLTRLDGVGFGSNVNPSSAVPAGGTRLSVRKGVRADVLSAGGSNGVCDLLREGNNLPAVSGSTAEHSFFRKECDFVGGVGCAAGGYPKDSNDNSADFMFADTQATSISGVQQRLGVPGPDNLASPVRRDTSGMGAALLDGSAASSSPPNRVRSFGMAANATFGTLTIRRRVTNSTGGNVTRLRFRVIEMTTFPSPGGGMADLRALTSSDEVSVGPVNDPATCLAGTGSAATPCTVPVKGLTLEQSPVQPNGGGYNSTLSAGTVTLGTPLANGGSLLVNFSLGVQQTGTFRFIITIEALP
jgi:hypothetical protein